MIVVSTREFRDNQKSYLDRIDAGLEVLIQRGKRKCYKIVPVHEDDTLMTQEEFVAKIDKSLQQAQEGSVCTISSKGELISFLDSI